MAWPCCTSRRSRPSQLLSDDVGRRGGAADRPPSTACRPRSTRCWRATHGLVDASFEVLDTYRMFAHSASWNRSLEDAVRNGLTAEAAVERVRSEHRARLGQARDPYLRERLHDLEDLNDRLLRHLSGDGHAARELPENAILIARNLGPGRPPGIRPHQAARPAAGGRLGGQPRGHRRPRARHPLRRPPGRPARPGLRRRPGDRRRRDRRGLPAAAPRRGEGHPGPHRRAPPAPRRVRQAARHARPSPATGPRSRC